MKLQELTDEFAGLDAHLLDTSARAEATLRDLLDLDARLAEAKRTTATYEGEDRQGP
ncbi:hypothetical protein [Phytohabitans houttuyneae]|uniref:Uncharacterized protein n=1 Tax=Phytohabitans houttuyneae TaxID=1076126 RepID=A0A6V8KPU5_9ACTN|nr:hypothetical protein [Phytohabitans houttuyneae]GFJ82705.1 hypothetical protein Phou_068850 [Phytohabitans houttuyneae]